MPVNKDKLQDCLEDKARTTQYPKGTSFGAHPEAGESARCCVDCGTEIPAGRLDAMPETKRCVECKRDIERSGLWDWGMAE